MGDFGTATGVDDYTTIHQSAEYDLYLELLPNNRGIIRAHLIRGKNMPHTVQSFFSIRRTNLPNMPLKLFNRPMPNTAHRILHAEYCTLNTEMLI